MVYVGSHARARTVADERRIFFQSLGMESKGKALPFEQAKENARRRAFKFPEIFEHSKIDANTNFDEDGDEMYHDLLDVLNSTQPADLDYIIAAVRRNGFKTIVPSLHNGQQCLQTMSIPKTRLRSLFTLVLSFAFAGSGDEALSPKIFAGAADNLINAFGCQGKLAIDFEMFDATFVHVAPFLFIPIFGLLSILFAPSGKQSDFKMQQELPSLGKVLTLPVLSQLATFLSNSVVFDDLRLLNRYTPSYTAAKIKDVIQAFQELQDSVLLLVSGQSIPDGQHYIFGVWVLSSRQDRIAIKLDQADWQPTSIFQLSLVHDVFHGRLEKPAWHSSSSGLWFGNEMGRSGVAMGLLESLDTLKVEHRVATGDRDTYIATEWRSNMSLEISVDEIEIWRW